MSGLVGDCMTRSPSDKDCQDCHGRSKPKACIKVNIARLHECLEFFELILDTVRQPFAVLKTDGAITSMNEAFSDLTGYSREELAVMSLISRLVAPELRDTCNMALSGLIETGGSTLFKSKLARKDGSRVPVELTVSLLCDEAGNPAFYTLFCTDVAEREKCEAALQESVVELDRVPGDYREGARFVIMLPAIEK
ncbi:PAS domain-containing protein [Methanocella sp. MCL-LM]|uniref:PAS domain-containing protein n=1 Tax=Methanocella sp. MCL-LM TaxID=3412035 RepID=UPI003C71A0C6